MNFITFFWSSYTQRANRCGFYLGVLLLLFSTDNAFGQDCSNNLLTNPGFENGLTGWNILGSVETSTDAYSGAKSAKFCTGGYTGVSQVFPASPDQIYTFKVFAKEEGNGGLAYVRLKFLSSSWQPIGQEQAAISFSWQEKIVSMKAPSGTAYLEASVIQETGSSCHFIDDLCLVLGGTAPCSITASVSDIVCSVGNINDPTDNTFEFRITASNPAQTTGYRDI